MRGMNLSAPFRRGSGKRYTSRPPAKCEAARAAWDYFHEVKGEPAWLQLLDGQWGAEIRGVTYELEAAAALRIARNQPDPAGVEASDSKVLGTGDAHGS